MDPQGLHHARAGSPAHSRSGATGGELELQSTTPLPGLQLPASHESQVFHIVQEALANVARHAAHSTPGCTSRAGDGGGGAGGDDGSGLPRAPPGAGSHYGLSIMQRAGAPLGGTLEVGPRAGGGTSVRLAFPGPPRRDA
jgi:two-component system nitrate/nitrite sensor histidine kinase NarX